MKRLNKITRKMQRTSNTELLKITEIAKLIEDGFIKVNKDNSIDCYDDDAVGYVVNGLKPKYVAFSEGLDFGDVNEWFRNENGGYIDPSEVNLKFVDKSGNMFVPANVKLKVIPFKGRSWEIEIEDGTYIDYEDFEGDLIECSKSTPITFYFE